MTEPTDAEIIALADETRTAEGGANGYILPISFARAVLAKWGTPPAVAGEQVGWMWQHDETGRTGFVDCWQVENGWQEGNPRLRLISKLYTTPQPTQAQAGVPCRKNPFYHGPRNCSRGTVGCCEDHGAKPQAQAGTVPMSHEAAKALVRKYGKDPLHLVLQVERHHGIKGGQHGTE